MSSTNPIRVAIAGLGRSGWGIHALTLDLLPDKYRVTHVVDADESRRAEAAERFGCATHEDYDHMIRQPDIDVVVVATPNHLHPEHTVAALQQGKHVVCEKPMAQTAADADRMIAAAETAGKTLAIFQNHRYAPSLHKVLEVINSGELGRIVQVRIAVHGFARRWDWQTLRRYDGGSLNNTGPHFLDHALEVLGDGEPEVFSHLDRALTLGDADDHVVIMLRTPGAPLVQLEVTSADAYPQDLWLVMGTRGSLHGGAGELHWRISDFSHLPERAVEEKPTPGRSYNSEEVRWSEHSWKVTPEEATPQWTQECFYRELYGSLREGKPLRITPQSIRRQIAIIEKCHAQDVAMNG